MPDVWTHIICGQEVLARVEERFRKLAQVQQKLFFLGCQGPDIFFYYNFLPWMEDKRAVLLGNRIHHERCGHFFRESLKFVKRNPDEKTIVYLMALICHWCLDRVTHPYINYISGVYRGDKKELINNHKRVEAAIDVLMVQKMLNIEVRRVPVHGKIEVGDSLPAEIVTFYEYILPKIYRDSYSYLKGTDFLNKSYRDMISALKALYDPCGLKRSLASVFDRLSRNTMNMRYYFYRDAEKNGKDYLNEKNREWRHPVDLSEIYSESFPELFEKGVEDSAELINFSMNFISGEIDEGEINGRIKDISYSTGKTESDRREMRHFKPILPGRG